MQKYLDSYKQMISLRGLTDHTIKSYCTYLRAYLNYLETILHKLPEDASWEDLRSFIIYIQQQRDLADRTVNTCISQLRFFTLYVLHKSWDPYQLPFRKFDTYLPCSYQRRIAILLFLHTRFKEKAMVSLLYSAGLRIGEVCHLKYKDIDRKSMRIHISHGKNRSDRYAILSSQALQILTEYWFAYDKPMDWLFPKQFKESDKPIDTFFLSRRITTHEERLGWEHRFTCHSFRHAFGTHLYENGTDLLTIKALLGHKSLNSTVVYVSLASNGVGRAISPFDCMGGSANA